MASRKDNLKSLFSNTRTRVIIIFTALLMILAVAIGYVKIRNATGGLNAEAQITSAPGGIQSIPGSVSQTAQYAKLQEEQNISQAQIAATSGGSAIPTIIKTQAIGEGVGVIGSKNGQAGLGFSTLAQGGEAGDQHTQWLNTLKKGQCSKKDIDSVVAEGAKLSDLKASCSCIQLKDVGYPLKELNTVCPCRALKAAGYNARDLKEIGYNAARLRDCGFSACELRAAGFSALEMKDGGFSDDELKGAGFSPEEIIAASGLPTGITAADIRNAGCGVASLEKLRKAGVSAAAIKRISGCSAEQLKAAGYTAQELKDAGFSAAELKQAGFSDEALKAAGFSAAEIKAIKSPADCSVESLKKLRASGVSASTIKKTMGCSAKALRAAGFTAKELKDAGFSAAELKDAGFSAAELKDAGFSAKELKDAGFSAAELKAAGFSAKDLKDAGFSAKDLKDAGFSAKDLKDAGFSAKDLKDAGFSAKDLKDAGFSAKELNDAGFSAEDLQKAGYSDAELKAAGIAVFDSNVAELANPIAARQTSSLTGVPTAPDQNASNAQQLQAILSKQNQQIAEQKYDQKIQQKTSEMLAYANQSISDWKKVSPQVLAEANPSLKKEGETGTNMFQEKGVMIEEERYVGSARRKEAIIKTGDILFAVMDTSVNSDEPGPILATIVSGKLKGSKLIGSFNLPSNAGKMVITFNTMSVPGAAKTQSISAFAIDSNTARTALSSKTNRHYLMRYGSLFASSFLQGFGNAFQSANTTVTIGGTGGGNDITVQNGIGRSTLQNAVIGLATVGKSWGQQAQQIFNTPTTVEVYSGTGIGVLFTQDVSTI
jgi:intracellular multiplication protein IcmE